MTPASLSIFDWVLLALLLASTIRAFIRGFLLEMFSLVGLIGGILLASWNYAALAPDIATWLGPFTHIGLATANILAFLLIVSVVMVVASLAGKLLRSSATAIGLGFFDRSLGAVFGFARGCLAGIACLMVLLAFDPTGHMVRSLALDSHVLPYFLAGARGVSFVVPATLQQQLTDGADRIATQIKHNQPVWIKPSQ